MGKWNRKERNEVSGAVHNRVSSSKQQDEAEKNSIHPNWTLMYFFLIANRRGM